MLMSLNCNISIRLMTPADVDGIKHIITTISVKGGLRMKGLGSHYSKTSDKMMKA